MTPVRRMAIYTRKSSEEGLEQDFNSLHAQREACEAYIASQRHEGWKLVRTAYDDGGLSGGTMERPALQRLLQDIDRGLIDGVVVYKVDRLTRSLTDFARIVERFDAKGVSFVSVTQSFNTTSSMGRLTLNMLLSFAQFEREVTGERIRDKIRQSKAKGLWMGGWVPFGYTANGRTLKVKEEDAAIVRLLFERYLELGTIPALKEDCDARGMRMPPRVSMAGRAYGDGPYRRGYLHKLLSNPVYAGKIRHGDEVHEGQHEAIVDEDLFDAVQQQLSRRGSTYRTRTSERPLLLGKLFGSDGQALTATHAKKGARRYRYYVGRDLRLPAPRIEADVVTAVRSVLTDPRAIADAVRERDGSLDALEAAARSAPALSAFKDEELLGRVLRVEITGRAMGLTLRLGDDGSGYAEPLTFRVPISFRKRGVEWRMVLGPDHAPVHGTTNRDAVLIRTISRALAWQDELLTTPGLKVNDIARREGCKGRYIARHLPLAGLSPKIIRQALAGTQPPDLTADRLLKMEHLPLSWAEQEAMFGIR